jgi:hypothetical protein
MSTQNLYSIIDVIQNPEKLLEKYPGPALKGQNTTAEFPWRNSRLKILNQPPSSPELAPSDYRKLMAKLQTNESFSERKSSSF